MPSRSILNDQRNLVANIKTPKEIETMAEGGKRLGNVLRELAAAVRPGITTKQLDRLAYRLIHASGAKPAFLHYKPAGAMKSYPYTLCASVNSVVVHGQPSEYVLREGDVLKLDLGLFYRSLAVDSAVTVGVGKISAQAKKLIAATRGSLEAGIDATLLGGTVGDIGHAVERVVKRNRFTVVEGLTGHGIGRALHEDPYVFNFGKRGEGEELVPGLVIAIEPMVAIGRGAIEQLKDESYGTVDGSLAAHFEHTVAITPHGPRVLTL